jgi:hypothetical protein
MLRSKKHDNILCGERGAPCERPEDDDRSTRSSRPSLPHLETGNDSFSFKNSSAKAAKPAKE